MNAQIAEFLARAQRIADPLMQKLCVVAAITKALEQDRIRPVVIGGTAVAFYTAGGYATEDIDLAVMGRDRFAEVMGELGFVRHGRFWQHDQIPFPIEAPASVLDGEDAPLTEVNVQGWPVVIIGIEDLIIDRLNAFVHWKSASDGEWVARLIAACRETVDLTYLRRKATEHGTLAALDTLIHDMADDHTQDR